MRWLGGIIQNISQGGHTEWWFMAMLLESKSHVEHCQTGWTGWGLLMLVPKQDWNAILVITNHMQIAMTLWIAIKWYKKK